MTEAIKEQVNVAILGAGFAGLGAGIRLKDAGLNDFVILEQADEVGGTWRDNIYPGCQCDVPSQLYSYSFYPNGNWSRSFALQPEILEYLKSAADKFGIRSHIKFRQEVTDLIWEPSYERWSVHTTKGTYNAKYVIMGNGPLSVASIPDFKGLANFKGKYFHSAQWDGDIELKDKNVAVIGTGASAIQIVPSIQPYVKHLDVYQRTPGWIVPRPDRHYTGIERFIYSKIPALTKINRALIYWVRELMVPGLLWYPPLLGALQAIAKWQLKTQVKDPDLRNKLTPDFSIGCKRILLSNEFYPAVGQKNTELITESIDSICENGIVTSDGRLHEADVIIFATGFKVIDNPGFSHVKGKDGRSVTEMFKTQGMQAYLGTTLHNFPNLFLILGPNTGLGHSSMVYMMESQINYILSAISLNKSVLEVKKEVQDRYNNELQKKLKKSVWNSGCVSWYIDKEGNNPTMWPGFTWQFRVRTKKFDLFSYDYK
jgi:cation diffusion facilitator CzcD-associated flavoprotein CzcO